MQKKPSIPPNELLNFHSQMYSAATKKRFGSDVFQNWPYTTNIFDKQATLLIPHRTNGVHMSCMCSLDGLDFESIVGRSRQSKPDKWRQGMQTGLLFEAVIAFLLHFLLLA